MQVIANKTQNPRFQTGASRKASVFLIKAGRLNWDALCPLAFPYLLPGGAAAIFDHKVTSMEMKAKDAEGENRKGLGISNITKVVSPRTN